MISTPFVAVPPPRYGGTELIVGELVDGLSAREVEVTLFATGDSEGGFRHGCEIRSQFDKADWPPSAIAELEHSVFSLREVLLQEGAFDVVHAHCPSFLPLADMMLDVPVVYTLHHPFDATLSRLYQRCRDVTYVSISHRQQTLCGPFERSAVVHHGVDPGRYRLGKVQPDLVAFLGRLSQQKGPDVAIDLAKQAGLRIRLGGKPHGDDGAFFERELEPRLRQPHVEWPGEMGHDAKVEMLASARAMLFPIDWEEPFGLVAIEAMLCGCPVIAFGRGAVPELVEEGVTGFIARDRDHMLELLQGPARPDRFDRVRCRERAAQRFGSARMADDYLRLYRDVAGLDDHDTDALSLPNLAPQAHA